MKSSMDREGRVQLEREPAERTELLQRLRRVEGQVRGLVAMVEADRYCGDELQQIAAARSALREVAVMLASQHIAEAASYAIEAGAGEAVMTDVRAVLRAALRQE